MILIWSRVGSPNVQKVIWCAHELGLAYDLIAAGNEHRVVNEAWYLAMNSNVLILTIDDDGFVHWESTARHRKFPCDQCAMGITFLKSLGFMHFRYNGIVSADGFQNVKAFLSKEDADTKCAQFGACFMNTDAPTSLAKDCCSSETRKFGTEIFN